MATTLTPLQMTAYGDLSLGKRHDCERAGFMPRVQRLPAGRQRYDESDSPAPSVSPLEKPLHD